MKLEHIICDCPEGNILPHYSFCPICHFNEPKKTFTGMWRTKELDTRIYLMRTELDMSWFEIMRELYLKDKIWLEEGSIRAAVKRYERRGTIKYEG